MRAFHLTLRRLLWLGGLLFLLFLGYAVLRQRPQDLPWTDLDLAQPVGLFTGRKLAALTGDAAGCKALLDRAGIAYTAMKPGGADQCHYIDAVRLKPDSDAIALAPASVAPSCPVVAALKLWEWQVVQPAAQRIYGQPVRSIRHFGSYSCRRMYGRSQGDFSEHATADAIDVAAFVLKDGRQVSVLKDWKGEGKDAAFLRDVRDGACRLFSTVLSPDYNAAHRDHFHLDQAERGATGWRACW
ncbi:extensin-like domain-containing protein [Sphingobium sp. YR768]|uniref:extensin-like domain-containing protein n=1 Tax=Sphingobium sp. YR768 TaxID=1884365 RepID=UPI0008B12C84|nr:extensin family protein [Sphingobium sp. YR768]SEQ86261.1 Extensin-like protein C-terminus [Sphingobium sp. YR768]